MKPFFSNSNTSKIFCIGFNKTGTTTIESVLKSFGYKMGDQVKGERLLNSWLSRDFKPIVELCKTAEAFQDIPFSLPYTYVMLDQYFKDSKFILTIRDDAEQWYQSLVNFHSKLWSNGTDIPTIDDLKRTTYRYEGFAYDYVRSFKDFSESDPYNKASLIQSYNSHIENVKDYFKYRKDNLIVVNVSNSEDYGKLCQFLNKPNLNNDFPWENRNQSKTEIDD